MANAYKKQVLTLTSGVWTPVVAPIWCNTFWVFSDSGQPVLEDTGGDGMNVDTINPLFLQYLSAPAQGSAPRFQQGEIITYLSVGSGSINATVTFVL